MTYLSEYTIANNGRRIAAVVTRLDEGRLSWRSEVKVDGTTMAMAHFATKSEAYAWAAKMVGAYLEVHNASDK